MLGSNGLVIGWGFSLYLEDFESVIGRVFR